MTYGRLTSPARANHLKVRRRRPLQFVAPDPVRSLRETDRFLLGARSGWRFHGNASYALLLEGGPTHGPKQRRSPIPGIDGGDSRVESPYSPANTMPSAPVDSS